MTLAQSLGCPLPGGERKANMTIDYAYGRRTQFLDSHAIGWRNLCDVPSAPTRSTPRLLDECIALFSSIENWHVL